ncbi:MAG: MBL fold metallo-hydrolase [Candidatus Wildermuthbacteria bacterium]|nr:MBL fold metallo-hydrolase [Candidatus Wildermuthbacteria bacterium]
MDKKRRIYVLGGLVFLLLITVSLWSEVLNAGSFQVTFFNVGQGDAAFVRTSFGKQIVIDGGPDNAILEKLAREIPLWDRTIDMVILSHPAQDHVAGLVSVLEKYRVQNIIWNGIRKDTEIFKTWIRALEQEEKEGAVVSIVRAPGKVSLKSKGCPQFLDILYPINDIAGKVFLDDNDTSAVVRVVSCDHSVLFTGDLSQRGEKQILSSAYDVRSDVLKVGHHGSRTSSSEEFIQEVSPDVAVISSGRGNRYGHPHEETLATLEKYGIDIRRTDEEGDIVFKFK